MVDFNNSEFKASSRSIKWDKLRSDVDAHILILKKMSEALPPEHPVSDTIMSDIVVPALGKLADFCAFVEVRKK
jgi:hypothetical protein